MYALANAFSLNMLPKENGKVTIKEIDVIDAVCRLNSKFKSYIGHQSTASLLSYIFNEDIEVNRESYQFSFKNNKLLVAQYSGPRLEEGTTSLPENAEFRYFEITYVFEVYEINEDIEQYMNELPLALQETLEGVGMYEEVSNVYIVKSKDRYYSVNYKYSGNVLTKGYKEV